MAIKLYRCTGLALAALCFIPALADNPGAIDTNTITVPISMQAIDDHGGYQPAVSISVAGGPPTLVNFDTGSVGLHIFASQVGSQNITYTNHHVKNGYASGLNYEGVVAFAPVTIGGITTKEIPIVVIQKAYCSKQKPHCQVANDDPNNPQPQQGMYGIMGVSMQTYIDKKFPKQTAYSPMRAFPGNYGSGFIIKNLSADGGELVLGLNSSNRNGFNMLPLPQIGTYQDGAPIYDDKALKVRYTIGETTRSLRTAFDSGGDSIIHLFTGNSMGFPATKHKTIKPNKRFEAILDNGFDWQFTTGNQPGVNFIKIQPIAHGKGGPYLNTGNTFFTYYDVMYDFANGQLGFKPHN